VDVYRRGMTLGRELRLGLGRGLAVGFDHGRRDFAAALAAALHLGIGRGLAFGGGVTLTHAGRGRVFALAFAFTHARAACAELARAVAGAFTRRADIELAGAGAIAGFVGAAHAFTVAGC